MKSVLRKQLRTRLGKFFKTKKKIQKVNVTIREVLEKKVTTIFLMMYRMMGRSLMPRMLLSRLITTGILNWFQAILQTLLSFIRPYKVLKNKR